MTNTQDKLRDIKKLVGELQLGYPTETNAFLGFMQKAEDGKAIGMKEKELINVALSVAAQCEWCIAIHVQHAVSAGASRDEIVEAGFMAIIMHGGPAFMYMIPLLDAINEYLTEAG